MKVYELMAKLLVLLLSAFGYMRGSEFIVRGDQSMKNASDIYIKLSHYIDVQSVGWLLIISSTFLFIAIFTRTELSSYFLLVGGLTTGTIHIFYGLIAVEEARVIATYYTTLSIGIFQYILAYIGGVSIWKIKKKD